MCCKVENPPFNLLQLIALKYRNLLSRKGQFFLTDGSSISQNPKDPELHRFERFRKCLPYLILARFRYFTVVIG
jgi:hypothetical protein